MEGEDQWGVRGVGREGFLIKFCMNSKVGIKDYRTKMLSFLFLSLYLYIALNLRFIIKILISSN